MSERTRIEVRTHPASTDLSVGSLFAGIGGLDLGLERAGMDVAWQVEIDPFCRQVLARHWPDVPRYGDVTELDFEELEPVNVICGGFPCQPASHAGGRRGRADDRWLWPHFARAISDIRPGYVVVENVPGLLTVDGGRAMGEVVGDLADLGYDAEWSVVSACSMGAPHTRGRLFLVAYPDCGHGDPRMGAIEARQRALPGLSDRAGAWRDRVRGALAASRADGREDDGSARRMVSALGNAVVPQVAEFVGRLVVAHAERMEVAA